MTQTHEWKWDGRVAIMAGQKLVAVLGSEMGADEARLIESAPRMLAALIDCRRALELAGSTGELAVVDAAIAAATNKEV
ncbi:hypothetical protein [Roseateles sp. LKC17W]|uniref:Uncharacterized protein n=1 Tax=Pelomonas margarita TaxID=3299031 RepID=A0ABW7FIE7_9BURK